MPEVEFGSAFRWFSAFVFSTTVHEAMHAWAAYRGGDPRFDALLRRLRLR